MAVTATKTALFLASMAIRKMETLQQAYPELSGYNPSDTLSGFLGSEGVNSLSQLLRKNGKKG